MRLVGPGACCGGDPQTAGQAARAPRALGRDTSGSLGMGFFTPMSCALLLAVSACLVVVAPVDAQRSVPVSNTVQFAAALQNAGVSEIILDPTNTGVRACTSSCLTHCLMHAFYALCIFILRN